MATLQQITILHDDEIEHKFTFGFGINRKIRNIFWHNNLQKLILLKSSKFYIFHIRDVIAEDITLKDFLLMLNCSKEKIRNMKYTFSLYELEKKFTWENYVDTKIKDLFPARFDVY